MHIDDKKKLVAVGWVSVAGAGGLLAQITSPFAWLILATCTAVPLLVMARLWNDPQPTLSQSIQKELR